MWSSKVFPTTIMSSRYTRHVFQDNPFNTLSMSLSKVAGALHNPKGITLNCHRPDPIVKAVFSRSSGARPTCQYPLFRSRVENNGVQSVVYPRQRIAVFLRDVI